MRRLFAATAAVVGLAVGWFAWQNRWPDALTQDPLSVLLVSVDTLRADRLGSYGYEAAVTPVLDRLAARGMRFEQAATVAPLTLPAHA